eukprot:CAMPEP_0168553852 /NCGR_PEP_ID=MMETSP0413-20121227/7465_1 /TAXON_ID=136452 /ORGANISM="Filamoeba nolandi, Strain NC-AS-23-1" /LENGTH=281 /DNA_ID=CAMNT_0008584549 /DNA_START=18 /DNA_END=860 /DNA_ORIENTATION=-
MDLQDAVGGIAITDNGDIYYSLRKSSSSIWKFTEDNTTPSKIVLEASTRGDDYCGRGIVWNQHRNSIYVCAVGGIFEYNTHTGKVTKVVDGTEETLRDGSFQNASVRWPWGITVDKEGNLLITDQYYIRKIDFTKETIETIADCVCMRRKSARFNCPWGIAPSNDGSIYVTDRGNCCVRKITNSSISILVGTPGIQGGIDGRLRICRFRIPIGLIADDSSLLVADQNGIRRVDLLHNAVTTLVRGIEAQVLTKDKDGNLYVGTHKSILKLEPRWKYERLLW